jgi:hypothetical protein
LRNRFYIGEVAFRGQICPGEHPLILAMCSKPSSSALIQGQPQSAGSVARVPAAKIEAVIVDALRRHIGSDAPVDNAELITAYARQIEVRPTEIAISLLGEGHASEDEKDNPLILTVLHREVAFNRESIRQSLLGRDLILGTTWHGCTTTVRDCRRRKAAALVAVDFLFFKGFRCSYLNLR